MHSGIYIKIGISYERYSFWHHQDSREAILALWIVVLKYLIYISLMSCYLWRLAAYLWPRGMVGKVLASGSRPARRTLKILRLEAKEVFTLNFGAKIKFVPVSFSWLHHVSVILVHSCPDKNRQEWTWMKKVWCNQASMLKWYKLWKIQLFGIIRTPEKLY